MLGLTLNRVSKKGPWLIFQSTEPSLWDDEISRWYDKSMTINSTDCHFKQYHYMIVLSQLRWEDVDNDCSMRQWGKDKKAAMLQMHFKTIFFKMKIAVFWFKFHWYVFTRDTINNKPALVQNSISLTVIRQKAITWTNGGLVYRHIYSSCSLNVFVTKVLYAKCNP